MELIKVMPYSLEAEQMVLGCILIEDKSFDEVAPLLKPESFYFDQHKLIYKVMCDLKNEKKNIDSVILVNRLNPQDLEQIGGIDYVNALAECTPSAANIREYAKIVHERFVKRESIKMASEFIESCYDNKSDLMDQLPGFLTKISGLVVHNDIPIYHISDIVDTIIKLRDEDPEYITSGCQYMDEMTDGGFRRGQLVVLAGRPGMGKTCTALNIFSNMSKTLKTIYFSLEMSLQEIVARLYANLSGKKIKDKDITYEEADKLLLELSAKKHLSIIDNPRIDLNSIKRYIIDYKIKHGGCDVIFIDYLQLMTRKHNQNEYEFLSFVTRELKILAQELHIVIICVSQLSRGDKDKRDKRPHLSDLRGSGSIEQDSDMVIFIHREEYYYGEVGNKAPDPLQRKMEIIVAKNRNYRQEKMLYVCDLSLNRLIKTSVPEKIAYYNFLENQRQPQSLRKSQ